LSCFVIVRSFRKAKDRARFVADVNADGYADLVAFEDESALVAQGNGRQRRREARPGLAGPAPLEQLGAHETSAQRRIDRCAECHRPGGPDATAGSTPWALWGPHPRSSILLDCSDRLLHCHAGPVEPE
jgi:hypothetical protein